MLKDKLQRIHDSILEHLPSIDFGHIDAVKHYGSSVVMSDENGKYEGIQTDSGNFFYIRPISETKYKSLSNCGTRYEITRDYKLVAITLNCCENRDEDIINSYLSILRKQCTILTTNDNRSVIYNIETEIKDIPTALSRVSIISIDFRLNDVSVIKNIINCPELLDCLC